MATGVKYKEKNAVGIFHEQCRKTRILVENSKQTRTNKISNKTTKQQRELVGNKSWEHRYQRSIDMEIQ